MRNFQKILKGILVGIAVLGPPVLASAQENLPAVSPPPANGVNADELKALRESVEALNQKILILERKQELDKEAADTKAKTAPVVEWKDGFTIKTPDNAFTAKIGGWIAYDVGFIDQDDSLRNAIGDEQDGTGFRSARIRLNGTWYTNIAYQAEYDFAGENGQDTPAFYDTYVQFNNIPYIGENAGSIRVGHFREPFSLEELTSQPARLFLERSLASVFYPSRNARVQWSDALLGPEKQERLTYAVGVFKTTDNWPSSNDGDEDQGYNITARVTGVPWLRYNGQQLIHLGAGYSHKNPDGATLGWNVRPETRLTAFRYVNADASGAVPPPAPFRLTSARADDVDLYNLEAALLYGPLLLQGEYTWADVDTTFDGNRNFDGYYIQAAYVLTGENRIYNFQNARFERPKPKKNAIWWGEEGRGWGAWELAARYSSVDLNDGGVRGGEQDSITAGINWFMNPSTKISLNYIWNDVENDLYDGNFDLLQLRVHIDL